MTPARSNFNDIVGSTSLRKQKAILQAVCCQERPTLDDISNYTGIPKPTIKRQIRVIRDELRVDIRYIRYLRDDPNRPSQGRGSVGYYRVCDWGQFDEEQIKKELKTIDFQNQDS